MTEEQERAFFRAEYERAVAATRLMATKAAVASPARTTVDDAELRKITEFLAPLLADYVKEFRAELADLRKQLTELEARHALDRRVAALEARAASDSVTGPPAAASVRSLRRIA